MTSPDLSVTTDKAFYWAGAGPLQQEAEMRLRYDPDSGQVTWIAEMVGGGEIETGMFDAVKVFDFLADHISDAGANEQCSELPGLQTELTFKVGDAPYTADFTDNVIEIEEWLTDVLDHV